MEPTLVVVVDDDHDVSMLCRMQLAAAGFEVAEAHDGAGGLALAESRQPAVIVLDYMLPDLDGVEVLRRLNANPGTADIPVIMLTARTRSTDQEAAWNAGVWEYLTKPFDGAVLVAAVRAAADPGRPPDRAGKQRVALDRLRAQDSDLLERLAAIVEHSQDAIFSKTLDGVVTSWNTGAEWLYGYPAAEMVGRNISMLIPAELQDGMAAMLHRLSRGERIDLHETTRLRKDGHEIEVSASLSPIKNRAGEIVGAAVIARDITERKRAEDRFHAIVESAPDAIVIVDEHGWIQMANRQTEVLFGYTKVEIIGQRVEMLIPQRFRSQHPVHRTRYSAAPRVREMGSGLELTGLRKDGSEFPVEISLSPMTDEDGAIVSAAIRDVTERKNAQRVQTHAFERERAASQRLRDVDALRADFLSTVSHELRTPLTTIKGFADLLSSQWNEVPDEQRLELVGRIARAGSRLDALIGDLLDFSRLERGEIRIDLRPLDVRSAVEGSLERSATLLERHRVVIDIAADLTVLADESALTRVVENLLSNAAKFAAVGSTITVGGRERAGTVLITIGDEGPGIAEHELPRIFDRFYRVGGQNNRVPGTGIGLAIVKEFTEAQRGTVTVSSTVGSGTEFGICLSLPHRASDVAAGAIRPA